MNEPEIVREFKKCYNCGHEDTCASIGCEGVIDIPEGKTIAVRQDILLLQNPQLAVVNTPALVYYYDVCANCGANRCIRVEKRVLPLQYTPPSGMTPMQGHGNNPPLGRGQVR